MVLNGLGVIAAVLSVSASLLTAIGIGTTSWTTVSFVSRWAHFGLFRTCVNEGGTDECSSNISSDTSIVICGSRTTGDANNYFRAMEGFAISTMLIAGIVSLVSILQAMGKWRDTSTLPALLACVLGFVSGVLLIILWAIFAASYAFCGTSICSQWCDGDPKCSCGMGFSFYLVLISTLLFGVIGALEFFLRRQFSSGTGYSAVGERQSLGANVI